MNFCEWLVLELRRSLLFDLVGKAALPSADTSSTCPVDLYAWITGYKLRVIWAYLESDHYFISQMAARGSRTAVGGE